MKKIFFLIVIIIAGILIVSQACKEEELPEVTGNNKIELTIIEDSTSYVFAELTCSLNELPNFEIEQHGFCWDTVASVNIEKQSNIFGNLTNQTFQKNIESLLPYKTYFVKGYIQNGDVVIYSNELTIQTLDARPVVTTSEITNIKGNRAESGGSVTAYETLFPITQRGICWAKTTNPTIADSLTTNGTGNGTFDNEMLNLDVGANYFVRAYAINSEGISYGEEKSFSTLDGVPELTTDSITNVTATSATYYANITDNDGLEILEKGFCWNTSTNPTIESYFQNVTGNTLGSFYGEISGLDVNTTYYVKGYMKNIKGTFYGNQLDFTTEDGLPSITTTEITDITATSASSGGSISDDGGFEITTRGVCWSTSSNPTINDNKTTDGTGIESFSSNITGLDVSTAYYVRAYATNSNGTVYGAEVGFTTEDGLPIISTTDITDITATTAISGGNITDDGGATITERGICWNTSQNPTTSNNSIANGAGTGSFTANLSGLSVNTTYYVCAYTKNVVGTTYGNEISFKTDDGLPTVTTTTISNITAISAESGGNVIDDGGFVITARGVCWSTTSNPIISDSYTTDGIGTGSFTSNIIGLADGIPYYVRAYATNEIGTTYGGELIFSTSILDYDNNEYKTVLIGTQVWMAENLKTTHYDDGTEITLIEDNTAWEALYYTDTAYCYYNNSTTNADTYGALYTWAAAMNGAGTSSANPSGVQGACPAGWHLPSDEEWKQLEMYLGMSPTDADNHGYRGTNEGSKLAGTNELWIDGSLEDDIDFGESGFMAIPGGYRNYDGAFKTLGETSFFWSATEYNFTDAYFRNLLYSNAKINRNYYDKDLGKSVRCIKD